MSEEASNSTEIVGPGASPRSIETDPAALLRVAASTWWHTAQWSVGASARAGRRLARAAVSPSAAAELLSDIESAARGLADVTGADTRFREVVPQTQVGDAVRTAAAATAARVTGSFSTIEAVLEDELRERGAGLLRDSRDVNYSEDAHPAYERIINEIAPDEARILRLLLAEGPQPTVDVRTGGPLGVFNSELIAPGLSMIGARSGCRYVDRVPAYLNNLFRLGLIWFSRETLRDAHRYQVIEAQPDVLDAINSVRMAKIVRRSIHLTPFGEDFCRSCLALNAANQSALSEQGTPDDDPT